MSHTQGNIPYQPSAFTVRHDCETRYQAIKESLGDLRGITVLDFGCAEGYFGFRFLQAGARFITFIDNDISCRQSVHTIAKINGVSQRCEILERIPENRIFSVSLFLDLWTPSSPISLEQLSVISDILFISHAGGSSNEALCFELSRYFKTVIQIHQGYENRIIFRCSQ